MISVLMPVYHVGKYLEKTLESVKNQTYADFEVIMVDDGSTDTSGQICDKWTEADSRFRVIHTENKGVSAARNTALSLVRGEYIFFMDSDDLIIPETFEELLDTLQKTDADMVMGNLFYTDNNGNMIEELNSASPVKNETLSNTEYLKKLTQKNANYYCTLWNKVYKAHIFKDISFPLNRINEDEARIHEVIFRCSKIVTVQKKYYNYIKHSASITGATFGIKNLDREEAFRERIEFFRKNNLSDLAERAAVFALDSAVVTFAKCVKNGFYYGNTKKRIDDYFSFFVSNCPAFTSLTSFEKKVYVIGQVVLHFPDLYAHYIEFFTKKEKAGAAETIKDELFEFILKIFSLLPTKNRIIFESHPEMACNTYPVYKYLLEKGLNKKYEFVWLSENASQYTKAPAENTSFINYTKHAKSFGEKLKTMYYISTAKALVYSNQLLGTYGRDRISLWLQHGMPLKASNGTYCIKNNCTNALCVSEFFADNFSSDARVDKDKMIFMGFPRNDLLLTENDSLRKFGFDKYDKVIFWLPTFRQRKDKKLGQYEMETKGTGIPAIDTVEEMKKINFFLKSNNCLLILKPHPVQDLSAMKEINLSNFFIISDNDLKEKDVQLYELLGRCDAMITDYSSVYYDYLLTDKLMGLTIGDIDEYIAKRGFVYKNPLDILKGEYIYDNEGLISFLTNVVNGNDVKKTERTEIKNMIHTIQDAKSAEMVGEYIIEQLDKQ